MRVKETADDYRLFPDPDLAPYDLSDAFVESCRAALPELPDAKRDRYVASFGVKRSDAAQLAGDPAVAALCGSKASQVERSIRSAIQTAWLHRDEVAWAIYFAPRQDGQVPRPTNAELISRLAEALQVP